MADEVKEKPPRTTKEHLAAILEVLICMDASVHRLEAQVASLTEDQDQQDQELIG